MPKLSQFGSLVLMAVNDILRPIRLIEVLITFCAICSSIASAQLPPQIPLTIDLTNQSAYSHDNSFGGPILVLTDYLSPPFLYGDQDTFVADGVFVCEDSQSGLGAYAVTDTIQCYDPADSLISFGAGLVQFSHAYTGLNGPGSFNFNSVSINFAAIPIEEERSSVITISVRTSEKFNSATPLVCTSTLGPMVIDPTFPYIANLNVNLAAGNYVANFSCNNTIDTLYATGSSYPTKTPFDGPFVIFKSITFSSTTSTPPPTINVANAHFEQAVQDPQLPSTTIGFDAVANKSASFQVDLSGTNLSRANPNDMIAVDITSGGVLLAVTPQIPVSQINSLGTLTIAPAMFRAPTSFGTPGPSPFVPTTVGQNQLTIHLDTTNASDVTAMDSTMTINVHQVITPRIGFSSIQPASTCPAQLLGSRCYTAPTTQNISKSLSSDVFVSATYPVPDHAFSYSLNGFVPSFQGSVLQDFLKALYADLGQLEIKRRAAGFQRMVGLVDSTYMQRFSPAPSGVTPPPPAGPNGATKSAIAIAGVPEVVAHELGHTFGRLNELYDLTQIGNSTFATYNNTTINGFDGTTGISYAWPPTLQTSNSPAISFMGPAGYNGGLTLVSPYNYWIDNVTYGDIFNSIISLPPNDPQTILISGVLTNAGQFIAGPSLILPNGNVTQSFDGGDVTITLLDNKGITLSQVGLASNFQLLAEYADGSPAGPLIINTGAMSVVVELPYSSNASTVKVSRNGAVLQKTNFTDQLIQGIISEIPDNAFLEPKFCKHILPKDIRRHKICDNYVTFNRGELNRILQEIQRKSNRKHSHCDASEIERLIELVKRVTSSNYTVADASELTQSEVISQLHAIIKNKNSEKERPRELAHRK